MAFSKQIPKDDSVRQRRNAPPIPTTILDRRKDNELIGPDLPKEFSWGKRTREWWDMWRRSEIAPRMEKSDWEHLMDTANLHNEYWSRTLPPASMTSYAAEIRRRVAAFGATLEDRLKLRIKFADTEESQKEPLKTSVPQSNYRDLLED